MTSSRTPEAVNLPVHEPSNVRRRSWPVTQGVPFAPGALARGTPVRVVDAAGRALPTQTSCLATWREDRKDVKWLLVDFQADLAAGERTDFRLEHGPGAEPPPPDEPVRIHDAGAEVVLDTGPLTLSFRRDAAAFWQRLAVRAGGVSHELFGDEKPGLLMRDHRGNLYDSRNGAMAARVEVEEAGPLRACIRVRGYHVSDDGLRFCPYILRIHAYAGSTHLRIDHTYIFDQEPLDIRLAQVRLHLPLLTAGAVTMACGDAACRHIERATGSLKLTQSTDRTCRSGDAQWNREVLWASMRGSNAGVVAMIRDMWQQYPKAIALDKGGLAFDIWPDDAPPLDYRNPFDRTPLWLRGRDVFDDNKLASLLASSPDAPLDLHFTTLGEGPQAVENIREVGRRLRKFAADRPFAFSNTDIARATGTAKTTELHLLLTAPDADDAGTGAFARAANEPLLALPPADYIASTGAVRGLHPRDPHRFPQVEQALDELFDRLVLEPQEVLSIYGHLNYGEMVNGHNVNSPILYRAFRENPESWGNVLDALGVFNNESQDAINGLWAFYLRSGDRRCFRFAESKSRHTEDVDFVHAFPDFAQVHPWPNAAERALGQMHYHSASNTSGPYVPSHSLVSGILRHYFLTGERRALDVARGMADNLLRNQTSTGVITATGLHRELTGPICTAMEVYQVTWERRLYHLIRDSLEALRGCIQPTGNLPQKIDTGRGADESETHTHNLDNRTGYPGGMLWYVMHDAWRLWAEPWMREWIITLAGSWVHGVPADDCIPPSQVQAVDTPEAKLPARRLDDGWYWHCFVTYANFFFDPLVALAWRLTGEERFLGYLAHRAHVFPSMASDAARCFTGHAFNAINHCGDSVPMVLSALAEAGPGRCAAAYETWKRQRAAAGFPVRDGDGCSYSNDGTPPGTAATILLKPPSVWP